MCSWKVYVEKQHNLQDGIWAEVFRWNHVAAFRRSLSSAAAQEVNVLMQGRELKLIPKQPSRCRVRPFSHLHALRLNQSNVAYMFMLQSWMLQKYGNNSKGREGKKVEAAPTFLNIKLLVQRWSSAAE